jgi:hypothetical protein
MFLSAAPEIESTRIPKVLLDRFRKSIESVTSNLIVLSGNEESNRIGLQGQHSLATRRFG